MFCNACRKKLGDREIRYLVPKGKRSWDRPSDDEKLEAFAPGLGSGGVWERILSYQFDSQLFGCWGRDLPNFLHMLIHPKLHNLLQGEAFRFLIKLPFDLIPDLVPVPAARDRRSDQEADTRAYWKISAPLLRLSPVGILQFRVFMNSWFHTYLLNSVEMQS